jgi:uncharacterized damage-inducible protein DinB
MKMIPVLLKEMQEESIITRKMLNLIPEDKYDWKPHPRSMSIRQLATHLAELPSWVSMALDTDELDFEKMDYKPSVVNNNAELLDLFEKSFASGSSGLEKATEEALLPEWTMRQGEKIFSVRAKHEVIRMAFCQTVHHRAQLGVFLRLLDVPIPGSYGPSADANDF